jgi:hypothetical protein
MLYAGFKVTMNVPRVDFVTQKEKENGDAKLLTRFCMWLRRPAPTSDPQAGVAFTLSEMRWGNSVGKVNLHRAVSADAISARMGRIVAPAGKLGRTESPNIITQLSKGTSPLIAAFVTGTLQRNPHI